MNILSLATEIRFERWAWLVNLCEVLRYDNKLTPLIPGQLKDRDLHSICWKHFLGLIPNEKLPAEWAEAVKEKRAKYEALKEEYILDPTKVRFNCVNYCPGVFFKNVTRCHLKSNDDDLDLNNPLSVNENSAWAQYHEVRLDK